MLLSCYLPLVALLFNVILGKELEINQITQEELDKIQKVAPLLTQNELNRFVAAVKEDKYNDAPQQSEPETASKEIKGNDQPKPTQSADNSSKEIEVKPTQSLDNAGSSTSINVPTAASTSSPSSQPTPVSGGQAIAVATLNKNAFQGIVEFRRVQLGDKNSTTQIKLIMKSMPEIEGQTPYSWHVHEKPVDSTGNCTSTGYHLDPQKLNPDGKNKEYKCNPKDFSTCELGDLSGKFGKIDPKKVANVTYEEPELALTGPNGIIGRSVVIHLANSTRIVCGNITIAPSDYKSSSPSNTTSLNTGNTGNSGSSSMGTSVFVGLSLILLNTMYLI